MAQVKLIPYTHEITQVDGNEIPKGIQIVRPFKAWAEGYKGAGEIIAVIDTGVDASHVDLKGHVIGGRNFTDEGTPDDYSDGHGHGTHVAGTIAALENGNGVVGVAPEAKILAVKVLTSNGTGSDKGVTEGIKYATAWEGPNGEKVSVINMSLGGPEYNKEMHDAVKTAIAAGIEVVVAAGNAGDGKADTEEVAYPGRFKECLTVGAYSQWTGKPVYFSNTYREIDIMAPGVYVRSTYPGNRYRDMSGTSMASPHVAGVLAILAQKFKKEFGYKPLEVELYGQLVKAAKDLGYDKRIQGHGAVDLSQLYPNLIEMNIGVKTYTVDGEVHEMDVAPIMQDGRTLVPIRFVGQALGAGISWQPPKTVVITK